MNLFSHDPGQRGLVATLIVAMLGVTHGPVQAAAAAPAAVLTPEQIAKLIEEGTGVLKQGNPELAIKDYFEPVNQSFMRQTAKAAADEEVYASHSATETTAYAAKVAKENEGAKTPVRLVTVDGAWTDSLVLKARALVELKRIDQAKSALNQALVISPANPSVWLELGSVYKEEKNWEKSFSNYKNAENYTGAVEDKTLQTQTLIAAYHGQANALTELARLDEAATLYKQCLKHDAGDTVASAGMARIAELRGASGAGSAAPAAAPPTATPPKPASH